MILSEPAFAASSATTLVPQASGAGSQNHNPPGAAQAGSSPFALLFASISSSIKDGKAEPASTQTPKQNTNDSNVNPDPAAIAAALPPQIPVQQPALNFGLMNPIESETQSEPSQTDTEASPAASSSSAQSGISAGPTQPAAYRFLFNRTTAINVVASQAPGVGTSADTAATNRRATCGADSQSAASRRVGTHGSTEAGEKSGLEQAPQPQPVTASANAPELPSALASSTPQPSAPDVTAQAIPSSTTPERYSTKTVVIAPNSAPVSAPKPAAKASTPSRPSGMQATEPNGPNLTIPLDLPQTPPEPPAKDSASPQNPSSVSDVSSGRSSSDASVQAPPASSSPKLPTADVPAFAMRITADSQSASEPKAQSAPNPSNLPDSGTTAQPVAVASFARAVTESKPPAEHQSNLAEGIAATTIETHAGGAPVRAESSRSEPAAPATPTSDVDVKPQAAQNEPVRNVHMQLSGDNNQRVDVRLADHGGELRVSVKAGDANLAQNLQDHMPELTARLDQQRFRTEVWSPRESTPSQPQSSSSGGGSYSNSDGNSRRQNGQQKERPEWLDELENQPRRAQTTRSN